MGLMNVGQTEGSQIIQLFGRGVRLKGYGSSLKRSGKAQRGGRDSPSPRRLASHKALLTFPFRQKNVRPERGRPSRSGGGLLRGRRSSATTNSEENFSPNGTRLVAGRFSITGIRPQEIPHGQGTRQRRG
jgi:hypothetical protein